ncbi:MAG: hypothetical protein MUF51_08215, partial [Vicinamibacteria bacterium]|nr:hypothetical protein [Vicinamibacteria bacterium]
MALIDIFRPKPKWQHKDANVRAEAVRDLPASEQDLLQSIARADLDARVRRLAVKKLRDTAILIEIARQDGDTLVREEAQNALLNEALKDGQAQARALALEALSEPRHFALAARTAALAEIRLKALDLLSDAKLIAGVAREAQDAAVRLRALGRVQDAAALLSIAVGCEFKDAALLALERIRDRDALKTIATRAKSKAAMRRARALLGALAEEAHALTPSERHRHQSDICRRLDELMRHHEWSQVGDALKAAQAEWEQCAPADPELAPRYATLVRALEAGLARYQQGLPQVEAKTPRPPQTDAARALIERVRVLAGASLEEDLERLQAEWAGLQLPTGAEGDTLQEQYTQTVADARGRVASAAP